MDLISKAVYHLTEIAVGLWEFKTHSPTLKECSRSRLPILTGESSRG